MTNCVQLEIPQLVFKAPLCITLTIFDQKIVSGSLFLTYNFFLINLFIFFLAIYYVTFQCGCQNIFRKFLIIFFDHKKLKKPHQKLAYFSRISFVSEILPYSQTAQMAEFMFPNVAYRATVYRTGGRTNGHTVGVFSFARKRRFASQEQRT